MAANQATELNPAASFPAPGQYQMVLETFTAAADTFIQHDDNSTQIWAASMDWFLEEWGRDTFIALPGLLLSTGRFSEAQQVFRNFAQYEHNGLIPNRIQPDGSVLYNTVDGSLWFIQALKQYQAITQDEAFVSEMMPTVHKIIEGYTNGTAFQHFGKNQVIKMDHADGLISSPAQATWMDADPSGMGTSIITPRNGKCVEINALWYNVLKWTNNPLASTVKKSFNKRFWNPSENCLLDVIDGDPHSGALRPNQVFAISHGEDLLSKSRQKQVLKSIQKDLLTSGGLRTLSPRDSHYRGHYDSSQPPSEKDWAYHQGTVWPWLIGPYCDALVIVRKGGGKSEATIQQELQQTLAPLIQFCLDSPHHSLPEVFSGDPPYEPGGTRSQAWSIAEVLRILSSYKLLHHD